VVLFSGDYRDAFKQLKVGPSEKRYLAGRALGGFFIYHTVLFGIGSGPLVWGRVAAAVMRLTQGALDADVARLQCFVDDPIAVVRGTAAEIRKEIAFMLLFWAVLGLRFAYSKAKMGETVPWIGALVSVDTAAQACTVSLPQEKIEAITMKCSDLLKGRGMVPADVVQRLAGQLSWVGGIAPQLRPFTRQLWGGLSSPVRANMRQKNGKKLIFLKQIAGALEWTLKFTKGFRNGLQRTYKVTDEEAPGVYIEFDASIYGGAQRYGEGSQRADGNNPPRSGSR
jgi:hypothetical protein